MSFTTQGKAAMKLIFVGMTVVTIIAFVFAYAEADLGFRANTKNPISAPTPVTTISKLSDSNYDQTPQSSINSTSKGIQLHFRDYPLEGILENIHDETGIRFNLSPKIANDLISIDIEARNWKSSVRKLITDYSRIEVWTNRPKTSRIGLLKSTPHD